MIDVQRIYKKVDRCVHKAAIYSVYGYRMQVGNVYNAAYGLVIGEYHDASVVRMQDRMQSFVSPDEVYDFEF